MHDFDLFMKWSNALGECGAVEDKLIRFDGLTPIIGDNYRCLCAFSRARLWIYTDIYILNESNGDIFCSYGRHDKRCGRAQLEFGWCDWNPSFNPPNVRFLERLKVVDTYRGPTETKRDVYPLHDGDGGIDTPEDNMRKIFNAGWNGSAIWHHAGGLDGLFFDGSQNTVMAFNRSWKASFASGYEWFCKYDLDGIKMKIKEHKDTERRIESMRRHEERQASRLNKSRKPGIYCIGNSRHIKVGMSDANAEMRARAQCNPLNECKVHWVLPTAKAMNTERKMHGWMHKHLSHIYGEWFSASVTPQDLMTVATSMIGSQPPQPVLAQ